MARCRHPPLSSCSPVSYQLTDHPAPDAAQLNADITAAEVERALRRAKRGKAALSSPTTSLKGNHSSLPSRTKSAWVTCSTRSKPS